MGSRENEFQRILAELLSQGRDNGGMLDKSVVDAACAATGLNDEQLALVYDYLKSNHIGVGEMLSDDEHLEEEEIDFLKMYLDELEALPDYTEGEKEGITISAMAGDRDAQSKLIEIYLPDVAQIAKLYTGQGVLIEDLIGEGNVALSVGVTMLGALEHQSEVGGALTRMIMDGMEECIAEAAETSKQDAKNLNAVINVADKARELSEELRRKVTIDELVRETQLTRNAVLRAITFSGDSIEYIDTSELKQ